jgi:hypothetical protein
VNVRTLLPLAEVVKAVLDGAGNCHSPGAENASYPSSKRPSESREKSRVPPAGAHSIASDDRPPYESIGNSGYNSCTRSALDAMEPAGRQSGRLE